MNADTFNALHKVGTPVFAYPGACPEDIPNASRLVTRTRSKATVLGGHTDVVWVDGHSACIALSHVDVVTEDEWKAAKAAPAPVAKPQPPTTEPAAAQIARLERKVASLKRQQEQDDAEYAAVVKERDAARTALREACDQIAVLESAHAEAVVVSESLNRRLRDEQLAGSALYAAMTMPTTPEQRQAALDQFTAVARQVTGEVTS